MGKSELDLVWIMIAASLVFLMQPGFMCLESGLTRSKNSINVAVKNLADFIFSVLSFWALGYGLMFGLSSSGLIGTDKFFLNIDADHSMAVFFLFQAMFCGTATTIFSGAVAERMKFSAYLLVVLILSVCIYPVFGHWAWNGLQNGELQGWLGKAGFVDFAGSTVVHSIGGWLALAVLLVVGPRKGRFDNDTNILGFNGSNLPLSVLGTLLLWFGWIGFNGGSTLIVNDSVPRIIVFTMLAACAGVFSNLIIGVMVTKIARVEYLINGSLGGLVAITACCHVVHTLDAIVIGLIAGVLCFIFEYVLIFYKIDDAVGAIPVHLCCGIWGTLAVAFFGDPILLDNGLSMIEQLIIQSKGVFAAFAIGFIFPYFIIKGVNTVMPLRVTPEAEHIGLNFSEHGATTELIELFQAMDEQIESSDLSKRMPVEPFTEVGLIAERHNQVMDSLENALSQTKAVVSTAKDAIVTCLQDSLEIININPSGKAMFFGPNAEPVLAGLTLPELFEQTTFTSVKAPLLQGKIVELQGKQKSGAVFPVEGVIAEAGVGSPAYFIGTFRDITEQKNREKLMYESEKHYRDLFENTGVPTVIIVPTAIPIVEMANHEFEVLSGYRSTDIIGKMSFVDVLAPEERARVSEYRRRRLQGHKDVVRSYETKLLHTSGQVKPILMNVTMIPDTGKSIVTCIDLTELKKAQNLLTRQRAYFLQLFEASSQGIVALNKEGEITRVNRGFEQLFGYRESEIKGKINAQLLVPADLLEETRTITRSVLDGNMIKKESARLHKDGRRIPVSILGFPIEIDGNLEGIFYIYEDISERKAFEEQLYHQAFFDGLTRIPNRILFMERLDRALERKKRHQDYTFALLLIDLDRFKWVNDSLGHLAGDELLQTTAQRFKSCIRSGDTVARLGGDEFAILLEDFSKNSQVIEIANRLQAAAQTPLLLENTEVKISASIGIVLNTVPYMETEAILRDADIAMYHAKELGKARFQIFNKKLHQLASESLALENDLREAIEKKQLVMHYQPIMSATKEKLIGFEALVRWARKGKELVSPNTFIPIAEETGLITPLGEWVLQEACLQMQNWQNTLEQAQGLSININISAKQFMQNDLVSSVKKILHDTGLPPRFLKLELTESTIMEGGDSAVEKLRKLKKIGLRLAIDDFGTGYSSLAALQRFPIDDLKIDRSFINGMDLRSENREIVKTIITLAKTLNLEVVAEGVETEAQLNLLRAMACNYLQGYYFSKPVNSSVAEVLIKKGKDSPSWPKTN